MADPGAVPRVDRSEARLTPGRRPGVPARGQPRSRPRLAPAVRLAAALLALAATPLAAQSRVILLATTTSTRDAGLLDSILPLFERQTGYRVKVVAVGSGQALALGRRGDADVVLAHAPEAERVLADSGYYVARRLVMHNEFLIVGPADDPAGVRGMSDAAAALRQIAERHAVFVSRGDESGTHKREKELWKKAGLAIPAPGPSYVEMGQGMGETLQAADEKRGYALTDIATYLTWRSKLHVIPLVEGDPALFNVYHVLELNPRTSPRINVAGGKALADFFVAPATQALIGAFGKARFGRSLFLPDAGKPDPW
ncbi:MAG TPA: substrate-binding domain-containing protein [Gemmatimonadales bacterium]|nr:substrate-binding domain-containing protein [Gemmatimonadales bacterium]